MDFQRARSEEQRGQRRRAILDTAQAMLVEMPVSELSLNELSRRVGLAKSNVLRYFESREAVLLHVLDGEAQGWLADLDRRLALSDDPAKTRAEGFAADFADTLHAHPMLCDLLSARSAVLERNISAEVALRHKQSEGDLRDGLAGILLKRVPELRPVDAAEAVGVALLVAVAAWPHERPSAELAAAYDADRGVAARRIDFVPAVTRAVTLVLYGLLVGRTPGIRITV